MTDARSKEIRHVLCGHFTYENDGALIIATRNPLKIQSDGMFFGIDGIRVLGMSVHKRQYMIPGKLQSTQEACVKALLHLGTQVFLSSAADTLAVLHLPIVSNPAVLTLDAQGNQLLFCVYTARSLFAGREANRIVEKWEQEMPENLRKAEVTMAPPCRQAVQEQTQEGADRTGAQSSGDQGS